MARLVLGGLELQDLGAGYWFDVIAGGLDDIAEFRGEDDQMPEAAGLDPGEWIADRRPLRLHGIVFGSGATAAVRRQSYRTRANALTAKMAVGTLVAIVAHPPNEGLVTGQTATLSDLRPQRIVGPVAGGAEFREQTLELVCIDSPPEWVVFGP